MGWGRAEGTGERLEVREGRSVPLAALQAQSSFRSQVRGPGNGSGPRGDWASLAGRAKLRPFCTRWGVVQTAASPWFWGPVWLSAHIQVLWDSQAHLRHLLNLCSVLTTLPAEVGAMVPSSRGQLLLDFWASCQDTWPSGHSASATHSRPHPWAWAWACMSVCEHA